MITMYERTISQNKKMYEKTIGYSTIYEVFKYEEPYN